MRTVLLRSLHDASGITSTLHVDDAGLVQGIDLHDPRDGTTRRMTATGPARTAEECRVHLEDTFGIPFELIEP